MIKYLLLLLVPLTVYAATTSIKDNTLKLGAKDSQDIYIYADNGSANLPFIFFDFSEGTWKQSNDGITSEVIGGASVVTTEGDLIIGNASGGEVRLPIGTNGKVLTSNGSSATWELPASGGINYITNFNIENDSSGYYTFDDASAYVDGTGVTSANLTISRNTTTPLRETGDLQITQAAEDSRYEGVSYDFTIDRGQQGQMITCSFWADTSDPNYVDDDIIIIAYDKDNSQIIRVNGEDLKANANPQRHYFQFQAASDADDYRVSWMVNQSNTNGYTIYLDQIACSPTRLARGAIVTAWEDYTPTGNWSTGVTYTGKWRRVGDTMHVQARIEAGASYSNTGQFTISIPSGYSIDTSKRINSMASRDFFGQGYMLDSGSAAWPISVTYYDTTQVSAEFFYDNTTIQVNNTVQHNNPFTWASGDFINVEFYVPIQGWASSGTVSEDLGGGDVVVRGEGNAGTSVTGGNPIDFTEVEDTTGSWDGSRFTAPETGYYNVLGGLYFNTNAAREAISYINGSINKYIGIMTNTFYSSVAFKETVYLEKGDIYDIRTASTATTANNTQRHFITIKKSNSGSQKFETATVKAHYTSSDGSNSFSGTITTVDYETKVTDSHNAYSGGIYTVPLTGFYCGIAALRSTSVAWSTGDALSVQLEIDGTDTVLRQDLHDVGSTRAKEVIMPWCQDLDKGQRVKIESQASQTSASESNDRGNYFMIWRVK